VCERRDAQSCLGREESRQGGLGHVMNEAAGDDDAASTVLYCWRGLERITLLKPAGQALLLGKSPGLGDKERVQVDAD